MATGKKITTYSHREFLFRLQTLIIDGGTEVIKNIFNQRLHNRPLNAFLAIEKTTVNRLRGQKIITQAQYDLLYPSNGQPATSVDLDITLIICLLRNIPFLGLNQNYKWYVLPQPKDTSVEADLCRLKGFRNEIAHISSTTGFQQVSFHAKWTQIEQVLLRLNSTSPNPLPNFNQTIDNYKNSPIDPSAEQRIKTITEQWRGMERGLESEMFQIRRDVCETKKDVREIKLDVEDTKKHVEVIKKDIQNIKQGMPIQDTDKAYIKLKSDERRIENDSVVPWTGKVEEFSDLQDDLISFYKRQHKRIPLSPLITEDQSLLKFYVKPGMQSIKVIRSQNGDKERKTPIRTLKDVFYKKNKLCSNIYLTADAGLGKTAFSKRLALAWCHAKKPDKSENRHFSKDEITDICGFSFVFLVLLRDSSSECDIDMLILNQIFSQLSHDYNLENLRNILHEETCLVVLDGLDEWTHPLKQCKQGQSFIPHQRARTNVAVLTTSRPWKLSAGGLHSSQIDQKFKLTGLGDVSATTLKRTVISHLHKEQDKKKIDAYEADFNSTVQKKHKSDLTAIPLFLMYFLFLWYYKFNDGKSLADLYSNLLELLLSRTIQIDGIHTPKVKNIQGNIPPCFDNNTLCKQFYTLLTSLGKLAFQTLFSETKEIALVFDGSVAEKYLNKEEFTFCLKTGIITQSKVQDASLLQHKIKVSFAHKTVQEFLAALYMNSAPEQMTVAEIVVSKCRCVNDVLDISKILVFIVGISSESSFSRELMNIINEDEKTQEYRNSHQYAHQLKDLQDMYISCSKEIPQENDASLCLQDVFIDESCQQEEYCENLKQLIMRNKQNIRSLFIDMSDTPFNTARKAIDYFALSNLENIEKLHYWGAYENNDILPLLSSSVKTLSLLCEKWPRDILSRYLLDKVTSLQNLEAIKITWFKMSHGVLNLLLDYISQRDSMGKIELVGLSCTDHGSSCNGLNVDLSRHLFLRKLKLDLRHLSHVSVNMTSLEKCWLNLSNRNLELKFLNCADNKLDAFTCGSLQCSAAIDVMLDMLRLSCHVRKVELIQINLGTRLLTFSPDFMGIKLLELWIVTMEASAFSELVDSVLDLHQTVTIDIDDCIISPREQFKIVKEKITKSEHFRILKNFRGRFEFETKLATEDITQQ